MARVRWAGVVFGIVQVATYYLPYPPGALRLAVALVAVLALGNVGVWLAARRIRSLRDARRLATASLTLDVVVVMGLVGVYTFDVDTAMWALVYVLPLEGAIKFQRGGALVTMAVAAVLYTLREVYGAVAFDNPFLATSISFRMGIGFVIAAVAGTMAADLVAERDELVRANEIKDDFLAMTNHELRTPLTTILGYTTMLLRRWDGLPDHARLDAVGRIAGQGERLRDLVEDLLTISSAREGTLQVAVQPVRARDAIDAAAAEGVVDGLECDCPDDLWVAADPRRLHQILVNLLSNARKYGAPPVYLQVRAEGESALLSVVDHGSGVPASFAPRLFDKFSQASEGASRTAEGTGLGLAIVLQLAEAQGGAAWYEPQHPVGSRFCVRLPLAEA